MIRKQWTAALAIGAIVLTACSDALAPGQASEQDQQDITAVLNESGFFADDFGADGATDSEISASVVSPGLASMVAAQVVSDAPRLWGRRRGRPVSRSVRIEVDREAGTAVVTKELSFDGKFLLDITPDSVRNPTEKPLQETVSISAWFRRLPRDSADANGHHWKLVSVSPAKWVMTDPEKRTVNITKIEISVGDRRIALIEDASQLLDVDLSVPRMRLDDVVTVRAWVRNTLDNGNDPATYVFLHVFHARADVRRWIRVPMKLVDGTDGLHYELSWSAKRIGRARLAVDAIDAQTFMTQSEDDYRANIIGIPYRIATLSGDEGR
ncbi:MAG: hypothetical protein ACE5HT_01510 [Gemmatimonadales bacterium]